MKVLFVSGGNSGDGKVIPLVKRQADSLRGLVEVDHFLIRGHGLLGYLGNVPRLREALRRGRYDLIHAHYSFSGVLAAMAGDAPIVTSLLGCDVNKRGLSRRLVWLFQRRWAVIIVKSKGMYENAGIPRAMIVPNGVDFSEFKPLDADDCRRRVGFSLGRKHVLFLADPARPEKNVALAEAAMALLRRDRDDVELNIVYNVPPEMTPVYLNAADAVLLTSIREGSPNVVKEAMACCRPLVSTDVGDVREIVGDTEGCHVTGFDAAEIAAKLASAVGFSGMTAGRENIRRLDSGLIADRLLSAYRDAVRH